MSAVESAHALVGALSSLDAREQRLGQRPIAQQDRTAAERADEVYVRLRAAVTDSDLPDLVLIEAAGAHLIALHQWAVGVHAMRVDTGDEATV